MIVHVDSLLTGASRASGAVVIIDVFRAFTTSEHLRLPPWRWLKGGFFFQGAVALIDT